MKAKVIRNEETRDVEFRELESGDWFIFEGTLHVKTAHLYDHNAIDFDDDMDPVAREIEGAEKVTPVNVTITY